MAGARSERLDGADKALVDVGGRTLLDRALAAAGGAARRIVVGPRRAGYQGLLWCAEDPPGGGPVAAFAAGLAQASSPLVLLLAVDLPFAGPAVPELLAAVSSDVDVAVLRDGTGRANYLASVWRCDAAERAMVAVGDPRGASMRRLVDSVAMVEVADRGGWSADCDTWEDIAAARQRLKHEFGGEDR